LGRPVHALVRHGLADQYGCSTKPTSIECFKLSGDSQLQIENQRPAWGHGKKGTKAKPSRAKNNGVTLGVFFQ
jgi:hypothetical protein